MYLRYSRNEGRFLSRFLESFNHQSNGFIRTVTKKFLFSLKLEIHSLIFIYGELSRAREKLTNRICPADLLNLKIKSQNILYQEDSRVGES